MSSRLLKLAKKDPEFRRKLILKLSREEDLRDLFPSLTHEKGMKEYYKKLEKFQKEIFRVLNPDNPSRRDPNKYYRVIEDILRDFVSLFAKIKKAEAMNYVTDKSANQKHKPGDVWETKDGKYRSMNQNGVSQTHNIKEKAKAWSKGPATNLKSQDPKKVLDKYTTALDSSESNVRKTLKGFGKDKAKKLTKSFDKLKKKRDDLDKWDAGSFNGGKKRLVRKYGILLEELSTALRDS